MTDLDIILRNLAKQTLQYPEPHAEEFSVRRNIIYKRTEDIELAFDVYLPAQAGSGDSVAVVIQLNAYPLPVRPSPPWMPTISWARLLAARGMASVVFERVDLMADCIDLLGFLGNEGRNLGINSDRIGLMASSGLGPAALGLLMRTETRIPCAVLNYPYLLDLDGHDDVASAAAEYGFPNPCAGKGPEALSRQTHLLITRAGQDSYPGLCDGIDRFVEKAEELDLPVSVIRHDTGVHAFDLEEDSAECRAVIDRILEGLAAFLRK